MITELDAVIATVGDQPVVAGENHPMRQVTRQVAFDPGGWTPERAAKVTALFDDLAAEWHTRDLPSRFDALDDALDRGGPYPDGARVVELGSGTGLATGRIAARFGPVLAMDLAWEMLRRAPSALGPRVQADAAALPVPDGSVDVAVLVNALLFPLELDRVLAPAGALVWVSSIGDQTPIYLSAADVELAMPGSWDGVAATAGWGTWCVLRRTVLA